MSWTVIHFRFCCSITELNYQTASFVKCNFRVHYSYACLHCQEHLTQIWEQTRCSAYGSISSKKGDNPQTQSRTTSKIHARDVMKKTETPELGVQASLPSSAGMLQSIPSFHLASNCSFCRQ